MDSKTQVLEQSESLGELKPEFKAFLMDTAKEASYPAGTVLFKSGDPAEQVYLIKSGAVNLEVYHPRKGPIRIHSLHEHDILGWSWLFPPYVWHFDARAAKDSEVLVFNGEALREKCEEDHEFGFYLLKAFSQLMLQRLMSTRLQLLDLYGKDG
jgi:CRP-like cAMP-binding protein